MNTLAEAWRWYKETNRQLRLLERLGRRYWGDLPMDGPMGGDDAFRNQTAAAVQQAAHFSLAHLKDLAIVVLFSVFEAAVRRRTIVDLERQEPAISHPALRGIIKEAKERIELGSFFQVLEYYKPVMEPGLVEEVNQVRRYRNWVAHGKRGELVAGVVPRVAYERLSRFLIMLGLDAGPDEGGDASPAAP